MAEKMYMYEYMICICMRIQILGKNLKIPTDRPLEIQNLSTNKNQSRKPCDRPKTLKQLLNRPLDNPKHSTVTKSNVEYVSTREHHNAQCQLHTKEKEAKWKRVRLCALMILVT